MQIQLDRSSSEPLVRQIVEQIRSGIHRGQIPLGSKLPTVRELAVQASVAHMTAYKAFEELRVIGLVTSNPRHATRVVSVLPAFQAVPALGRITSDGPTAGFELVSRAAGLRSMASSVPDPGLFQFDEFVSEFEPMRRESPWLYYYCDAEGVPALLEQIRLHLGRDGLSTGSSELLVTNGGTHALSLLLSSLCGPGDTVLVQEPGPLGLRELLATKGIAGLPVRLAGGGVDLDHVKFLVSNYAPKSLLVSPDYGHATGLQMSLAERTALIELAQSTGVRLIEDRSFASVHLGGATLPALCSLDSEVCAIGSFSYSLAPGIRTGYIRGPSSIRNVALSRHKAEGISGVGYQQLALARYLERGALEAHLRRVLPKYRARRDAMLSALKSWMPDSVTWTSSSGGFSTWVYFDDSTNIEALYRRALKAGAPFSPGSLFYVDRGGGLRLSYGLLEPEAIREAVRVFAGSVQS